MTSHSNKKENSPIVLYKGDFSFIREEDSAVMKKQKDEFILKKKKK